MIWGWFRKKSEALPSAPARVFPFGPPVFEIWGGVILVHTTFEKLGIAWGGAETWKEVRPVRATGRKLFGKMPMWMDLEFEEPAEYELAELRDLVLASIRSDPDDIWSQVVEHDVILDAVENAQSFTELADVVRGLGQGEFGSNSSSPLSRST